MISGLVVCLAIAAWLWVIIKVNESARERLLEKRRSQKPHEGLSDPFSI